MAAAPPQAPPRCTKCNSPPINGQCTNFVLFDVAAQWPLESKELNYLPLTKEEVNVFAHVCLSVC